MKFIPIPTFARRTAPGVMALAAALSFTSPILRADDVPSRLHELVNLEFASEYVTPRGMMVHNQGLTFQPLMLTLANIYHGDSAVNDVTLVAGAWNDFGTAGVSVKPPYGSKPKTAWTEIDPIAGISLGLPKKFKLDVTYSAFAEQILSIGTSQNLEAKLSFDDSDYLKAYALHPYLSFWDELQAKATDADVPASIGFPGGRAGASHPKPGPSYYFEFGVAPAYTFKNGIKLEAPCRIMMPDDRFYGDYFAASSFIGIWEIGLKGTVPMNFMPAGYGHWSFHAGVKYLDFADDNLYKLNIFNAPGKPTRGTVQGFCGVTIFF